MHTILFETTTTLPVTPNRLRSIADGSASLFLGFYGLQEPLTDGDVYSGNRLQTADDIGVQRLGRALVIAGARVAELTPEDVMVGIEPNVPVNLNLIFGGVKTYIAQRLDTLPQTINFADAARLRAPE